MKTQFNLLFFLLCLFSCKSSSIISINDIHGTYINNECGKLNSTLQLNKNGTYNYKSISWFENLVSNGTWKYSSKEITLNSYEVCEIFVCDSINSKITKWPSKFELKIIDYTNTPLIGVQITNTKTNKKYNTDINGLCEIKKVNKNDKLKIRYIGFAPFEFVAKDLIQEKFTIALSERRKIIPPSEENLLLQKKKFELAHNGLYDEHSKCFLKKNTHKLLK